MHKYLIEAIGTFFLVLVIGLTVTAGTAFAPLAIGGILMTMIYMGGHISGGHYNPAVSLAAFVRGALPAKDLGPYVIAQILGGLLGAALSGYLAGKTIPVAPGAGVDIVRALVVEAVFTFALASVVLNTATSKDHPTNSFYGLAIGFTVVAAAFAGGGISGGAFNPAVGIAHNVLNKSFGGIWIYLVGPLLGGFLAGVVFKVTNPHDRKG
jgi:aquaporin Z